MLAVPPGSGADPPVPLNKNFAFNSGVPLITVAPSVPTCFDFINSSEKFILESLSKSLTVVSTGVGLALALFNK